nr:prostaglandin E2 receptor EP2 subtype-like [Pogona vitticeps]
MDPRSLGCLLQELDAASAFYLLVSALATTDLLGKCLVSPIVLAAYARNRSLSELWPAAVEGDSAEEAESARPGRLCQLFAFLMAFFGLAPTVLLLAMALECWLSLGRPYFYERHTSRRRGALLTGGAALLCALFCALPFAGFGATVQYCPGTWCFIRMSENFPAFPKIRAYVGAFAPDYDEKADLTALRFFSVNSIVDPWVFIIFRTSVFRSCLRRLSWRLSSRRATHSQLLETWPRKESDSVQKGERVSVSEELDHLILLSIMTLTFAVCSLPFTIRAFMDYFSLNGDYKGDLLAMRFLSINSIIDPWVFVILRPSVLRLVRSVLCCQMPFKMPWAQKRQRPSLAVPRSVPEADVLDRGSPAFGQR